MGAELTPEQRKELEQFPPVLRMLIEAELAAGNMIVEVGHSFPAPPAGAYFKFAKKISIRPRASGDGLDFYEYNSSIYSGQFTDAKRFYFVIEPPNQPPPEPDMDAIRNKMAKPDEALVQIEQNMSHLNHLVDDLKKLGSQMFGAKTGKASSPQSAEPAQITELGKGNASAARQESTATSAAWWLHFRDPRPPQEILAVMEENIMKGFMMSNTDGRLAYSTQAKINGAQYAFELRFEAALPQTNGYSLRIDASWSAMPANNHDYFRRTADNWIDFWTRSFRRDQPVNPGESQAERYAKLRDEAVQAEAGLGAVPVIQQTIVAAMRQGAIFSTAHKEGGTILKWDGGRFIRSDYGDDPDLKKFADEAEFLKFLQEFYAWETSRAVYPDKVPELEAWRLVLRKLRRS